MWHSRHTAASPSTATTDFTLEWRDNFTITVLTAADHAGGCKISTLPTEVDELKVVDGKDWGHLMSTLMPASPTSSVHHRRYTVTAPENLKAHPCAV